MSDLASPRALVPASPSRGGARRRAGVAAAVVVVVLALAAWWPRSTVIEVYRQPGSVSYSDGRDHVAVLRHVRAPVSALRSSGASTAAEDHYDLVLGSDTSGSYGHYVRLDAGTGDGVGNLDVEWTTEGATIRYGSGHRLFVPATLFTGGR